MQNYAYCAWPSILSGIEGWSRHITKPLLVMKLTIILLTAAFLNVSAKSVSQEISFSGENVSLEKVFAVIKKQTGFIFLYNKPVLENTRLITIDAKRLPLEDFLRNIFKDQPLEYTIRSKTILLSRKAAGNSKSKDEFLIPPGEVKGRVTNKDGEPLAAANVMVKGLSQGASTDINGYYKLENIAAGEYTVVVSYIGYASKTATLKVPENGTVTLNFTLTPSLVNLDEYTITSTLSKRLVRAYPGTIAEIKQEDLKNRNLNNLANVLDAIPGIIITPSSENGNVGSNRQPGVLIRGANVVSGGGVSGNIKYLVDAVEIVTDNSILQTMDPNSIEKVEVLKGPMASTLYGSGSGGGIISITTKKGKTGKTNINFKTMFTQYANDYANYNGYNQNYSLNVSGGNEQFNYLLGAGYNLYPEPKLADTSNGINDNTWSYTAKIGGKVKNIAADVSLQYGKETRGSSSTDFSNNKYRESIGFPTYPVNPLNDARYSQRSFLGSLHLTHTIAANWYHDLTIGYNFTDFALNYYSNNYDTTYANFFYLNSKINARYFMFYNRTWSEQLTSSITAGFEYNGYETRSLGINTTTALSNFFTSYTPPAAGAATFTKSPYSSTGYFAEIVTGFKNKLFLTTGMRYDVNPAYGDNVSGYAQPRAGLSYVIEQGKLKVKPRFVWGVSSDPPDPTYKTTSTQMYSSVTFVTIGNADIKPQRSQGYEFGADIFYGGNYSLNVTYYDQKVKDMIQSITTYDFTTNPLTASTYHYNIAEVTNRGLEVSAKAVLDPFVVDLSYTQTVSKWGSETGQSTTAVIYPGATLLNIPKRSLFVRLTYKIPALLKWSKRGGNISLDWRYNGSAFNLDDISYNLAINAWEQSPPPQPPFPDYSHYYIHQKGYSNFNLRADYSITNFAVLYVDVQNLLDKQGSINGQMFNQFPGRRINFGFNINF